MTLNEVINQLKDLEKTDDELLNFPDCGKVAIILMSYLCLLAQNQETIDIDQSPLDDLMSQFPNTDVSELRDFVNADEERDIDFFAGVTLVGVKSMEGIKENSINTINAAFNEMYRRNGKYGRNQKKCCHNFSS